jgi:hypothetical protein
VRLEFDMNISGITWRGDQIDDPEILRPLPADLTSILFQTNGFILHHGALHVRGASREPSWHSIGYAWHGSHSFHCLYESINAADIPFAQDQLGDQFLLRDGAVIKLLAESDEVEPLSENLHIFFREVENDIENFLNVSLEKRLEPGKLWLAIPPFVLQESATGATLKSVEALEVIQFHADLARQIRDVPDGEKVTIKVKSPS